MGLLLKNARSGFTQQLNTNTKPWTTSWSVALCVFAERLDKQEVSFANADDHRDQEGEIIKETILGQSPLFPLSCLLPNHSNSAVCGNPWSARLPIQFYGPLPLLHVFTTTTQS